MTTLNPPPTVAPVEIDLSPVTFRGHSDVQPFTYRVGMSYTAVLESMRKWLLVTLVPYLNSNFEDVTDAWVTNVAQISTAIDTALATQADEINTALTEQQAQVATELANTLNQITSGESAALNDSAVFNALQVANSQALAFLDARETVTDTKVHDAIQPAAGVPGPTVTYLSTLFNAKQNPRPSIYPEDYTQPGDAGDWGLAITRALAAATPLNASVVLGKMYPVASTIVLHTNDSIIGLGRRTGVQAPLNAPITLLSGNGINGVHLENFTADGNALTLQTKSSARSVRFVNCNKIRYLRMHTRYNPDWATSFEQCTDVHVRDYSHEAGNTSGAAGASLAGRDGIHFLDCNDFLLDGARIHSRDDCVGVTSQTMNIARGTIRNVTGVSETAAVVTLGNESTSAFAATELSFENITSTLSPDYASATNYVVKLRAQNSSAASRIRVANVSGTARSHAVYLDHLTQVTLGNIDAVSSGGHGIYLNSVSHFGVSNAKGTSQAGTFDGLNMTSCSYGMVHGGAAENCSLWGMQINGGSDIQVWGFLSRDNGGPNFSSNTGGNLRVVNTTANVKILGGEYGGSVTTSYYGINTSGNTGLDITTIPPISAGAH